MSRRPRDRQAERAAINAAADRLLAGTPLRSSTGKLTQSELVIESALRRDVVYEHSDLVDDYKARVKAQHSTPAAAQALADDLAEQARRLEAVTAELTRQRALAAALRRLTAELSLELEQAREELTAAAAITRLPAPRAATIGPRT